MVDWHDDITSHYAHYECLLMSGNLIIILIIRIAHTI